MMAKATEPSLCELSSIALPSDSSNFFAKLIICPKTTPPSWSFVPLCESTFLSENERIPRFSRFAMIIAFLLFLIAPSSATGENDALLLDEPVCQAEAVDVATADTATEQKRKVHPDCGLVMAPSTLGNGTSGWGIFALHDMEKGQPVISGDVVIQLTDLAPENVDPGMRLALHDYIWSAEETGGFYEAVHTVSVIPGVGMLANGMEGRHNILPSTPDVDEAGLTRTESAGAGSVTHYHNYTFFIQKPVHAGNEILINYGANWFRERQDRLQLQPEIDRFVASRDVDWLRQHGQCLDNLKPVARSIMPGAGRGVVATRNLVTGTIVAPVPLLPMKRETLQIARKLKSNGSTVRMHQLFLNYCFGHNQSSLLLYPYGPMINLVNHGGEEQANVRVQWSTSKELYGSKIEDPTWFHELTVEQILTGQLLQNRTAFLLELVATRPIRQGEEVLLDYGRDWTEAWRNHTKHWQPVSDAKSYAPSYVHNDVIKNLRTEKELNYQPYPDNVFTSCYYRYTDNKDEAEKQLINEDGVTAFRWRMTRGLFDPRNLRPCSVVQRQELDGGGRITTFTVHIRNRYGLATEQRIPKGTVHIVTHVPRQAVRFSDKIYTTDQHLENAFRHEIGIPGDIFPERWKDLVEIGAVDH